MTRIVIVGRQSPTEVDAIRDHSYGLAAALRARGADVALRLRTPKGKWIVEPTESASQLGEYDAVLVQYNPFMWGRWGFAPWLPLDLLRLRFRRSRPRIGLMVHEPFVPMIGWRWTFMGLWQRLQLALLRLAADTVFVSIEFWTRRFARWWPQRPTFHIPVGSNFSDRSESRASERAHLGAGPDDLVVAIVDTGGSARAPRLVTAALERLAASGRRVVLLVLGAGGSLPPDLPSTVEAQLAGRLEADVFASRLAAADLFLAPYVDGVSTRRSSMMSALQHGVPVIGTYGSLTDSVLSQAREALRLAPADRPDLFADVAHSLASNADERAKAGLAGRELYRQRFDWPVIAKALLEKL